MGREEADARLLARIARGEPELVEILYERHRGRVYGYVCTLLEDPTEAEDVTHLVFETILAAVSGEALADVASFRGWLFAVARNRATDHRRKHGRVDVTAPMEIARRQTMVGRVASEDDPLPAMFGAQVAAALRRLPPFPREAVLLRYVGDLDVASIAAVLGTSEDSVKQAHRRAMRSLREWLGSGPSGTRWEPPLATTRLGAFRDRWT